MRDRGEVIDERTIDGFKVVVRMVDDDSPDLSYLGGYWDKRTDPTVPYYDRALERVVKDRAELTCQVCFGDGGTYAEDSVDIQEDCEACDGTGSGLERDEREAVEHWDTHTHSRECRYIIGGCGDPDFLKQDAERLLAYGDGWTTVGLVATAYKADVELGEASCFGFEYDWTPKSMDYLKVEASDVADEALAYAKERLAKLKAEG